jgi:HEAT repeats
MSSPAEEADGEGTSRLPALGSELTPGERARGQRAAVFGSVLAGLVQQIALGQIMMLYANDVLGFTPRKIAGVLAVVPLVALMRMPLLGLIRKIGMVRSAILSECIALLIVAGMILVPAAQMNFPLFLVLVMVFAGSRQIGLGSVWQPLLRGVTTARDRGRFYARMRFGWMSFTAVGMGVLPWIIGQQITEAQYKWLLGIAVIGLLNRIFWLRLMPQGPGLKMESGNAGAGAALSRTWKTMRTARVLRRPLLIVSLMTLVAIPVYVVYLRTMLEIPASVVTLFIVAIQLGGAISLLAWGRVADAIGFRPMFRGLIILSLFIMPLHLLVAPFSSGNFAWSQLELRELVTVLVLLVQGLIGGALASGKGIAVTSIQHYQVSDGESLEAMNVWNIVVFMIGSATALFHGFFLQDVVMPQGMHSFFNDVLYFDWMKGFILFVNVPVQLIVLWQVGKLTNTRPYFGVTDFFSSLSSGFVRSSLARRYIFHEDEGRRANVARWFGEHLNPVNIDPLLRLLTDPSYDVKVATIRSLARTASPLAGERLLELLADTDKRHLADHVAWALGELAYEPAFDCLVGLLESSQPSRIRAMAARALGKLGKRKAIEPLVAVVRDPTARAHELSSACRSLIRLKAINQAEAVFDTFAALDDRQERFELADALCEVLDITNRWLLLSDSDSLFHSLVAYTERQSPSWIEERLPAVQALRDRDEAGIRKMLRLAAGEGPYADSRRVHALRVSVERTDRFQALTVMAAAWLLLRRG